MSQCRSVEGILAASLYEAPEPRDAQTLREHLESCEACRREHERLQAMVVAVPVVRPEFTGIGVCDG